MLLLLGASAYLLAVSWRKWVDPVIDFGRELYLPWRISEGEVIYRDFDANYGPLSHYLHAGLFRLFGPGFSVLFSANLVIWGLICTVLYLLLRKAWGPLAAFVGSATFVGVFSFNQLVGIANYTFAAPYSHEATHGFLLVLIAIWLWSAFIASPGSGRALSLGVCLGLGMLLKMEAVFALGVTAIAGAGMAWRRMERPHWIRCAAWFTGGAVLPPLLGAVVLAATGQFSFSEALLWANSAWTAIMLYPGIGNLPVQAQLMGTDNIAGNLGRIAVAGTVALGVAGGLAAALRFRARLPLPLRQLAAAGLGIAIVFTPSQLDWVECGRAFPFGLAALLVALWLERQDPEVAVEVRAVRWLMLLAAGALLMRMALNPRIYQYGFFQAALAGVLSAVLLLCVVPRLAKLDQAAKRIFVVALGFWLFCGMCWIQHRSLGFYSLKTASVGEGRDRFFVYGPEADPLGPLVEQARVALRDAKARGPVLVMPEGVMLNYLLRVRSPSHVYAFQPYWLRWQDSILQDLERHPPEFVVLLSRDLREFGVGRFGESAEHGAKLMRWIEEHGYTVAAKAGGDPFDPRVRGAAILRRAAPSEPKATPLP